jgi:hydroxymethylpyrimidine/phosphomethylpyrimidine kinase
MRGAALSIAGSDPSGGAGIQADLKTFAAFRVYGAAVLTALTAQNPHGVRASVDVPVPFVVQQLDAVLDDLAFGAVKTGMLPSAEAVHAVARAIDRLRAVPLVVDPVLVSTSGHTLADAGACAAIRAELLPRATLVTPNLSEAAALTGFAVRDRAGMHRAAEALVALGARAALVKGGHADGSACDVLFAGGVATELDAPRLTVASTHGTGCTLSAGIAAALARGERLPEAVARAKRYVWRALSRAAAAGGVYALDHDVDPDDEAHDDPPRG